MNALASHTTTRTARRLYIGTCLTCGKRRYATRRIARRAGRLAHPGDHLRAYQCGGWWHIGHLPANSSRAATHPREATP